MNADGTGQTKLLEDNRRLSLFPAWSPDGKRIAFVYQEDNSEIYLLNPDDQGQSRLTRLTNDPAGDTHPAWSPDGKRIAFTSDRSGYSEIYTMDPDGSNLTRLTSTQATNNHPAWSPNGQQIAFASNRDGYWQIYVMNADGSQPVNLSNDPQSDDREPAWSPDGKRIVFSTKRVGETNQHLSIMNADGSGRAELTPNPPDTGQPNSDFQPAWSPDGQWIAFCSYRDNASEGEVYIIRADGSQTIRLTTQGGSQPTWKP
jgi:tol-pal system beta propeller repeat protein TolB